MTSRALPFMPLATAEMAHIDWLWRDWIPLGAVTMLNGDTGCGKTTIAVSIAQRVANGWPMPDALGTIPDDMPPGQGHPVLYCGLDDAVRSRLVPRFHAAGGASPAIALLPDDVDINLPGDAEALEDAIRAYGARLLVIDTFVRACDPTRDILNYQAATEVIGSMQAVAERTGAAVLMTNHVVKSTQGAAVDRGYGSKGGVAGVARASLLVREEERVNDDAPRRWSLDVAKANYGQKPAALLYEIEGVDVWGTKPDGTEFLVETSRIKWLPGLAMTRRGRAADAIDVAAWLRGVLASGPMPAQEVYALANTEKVPRDGVTRAQVDVVSRWREGKRWMWQLKAGAV